MESKALPTILTELQALTESKGYIYTLCSILIDDFHIRLNELNKVNYWDRLCNNEVTLLIGFLIKQPISLEYPQSPTELIYQKKLTYKLMRELHDNLNIPFFKSLNPIPESNPFINHHDKSNIISENNNVFIEPIFYAGDGIYDFQFLEYLNKKYKYDKDWLLKNKQFDIDTTLKIATKIKQIHHNKLEVAGYKISKKLHPNPKKSTSKRKKNITEVDINFTSYDFNNYHELLNKILESNDKIFIAHNTTWSTFYEELLDIFCICEIDFDQEIDIYSFINNFSISPTLTSLNNEFKDIGDFNIYKSKPIINLNNFKYFIPIKYVLYEAIYESPYYWMLEDKNYIKLSANRGEVGEEITYELLNRVFSGSNIYKSVTVEDKKGHLATDIDILCLLGSKAICVQVKSKKLTLIARQGSAHKLREDFKKAIQDAYNQAIICRQRILAGSSKFYDTNGKLIDLSTNINEVYILCVTTENYPALTHQTALLLQKEREYPYPLVLTIFDLELITHYLSNPYHFLYYIKQRIELNDYFTANEEIHLLGYHLQHKLWKLPDTDGVYIDNSYGLEIDQNYYPYKIGKTSSSSLEGLSFIQKNHEFDRLCLEISLLDSPFTTDIIFYLFDFSSSALESLCKNILRVKTMSYNDGKLHDFSNVVTPVKSKHGITYISSNSTELEDLVNDLNTFCNIKKYSCQSDLWIGLGSLLNSENIVDYVIYLNQKWTRNEDLELMIPRVFHTPSHTLIQRGRKTGRNELCPCNSNKKFKHCCGS